MLDYIFIQDDVYKTRKGEVISNYLDKKPLQLVKHVIQRIFEKKDPDCYESFGTVRL